MTNIEDYDNGHKPPKKPVRKHRKTKQSDAVNQSIQPQLPTPECPSCGGTCIPLQIQFACDKCVNIYGVQVDMFNEISFSKENAEHIAEYMKGILEKNRMIESFKKNNKKIDKLEEDELAVFTVSYQGEILDIFKSIKKEYELGSLMNVVRLVNEGFLLFLRESRKLSGESAFVVNEFGNKTPVDIKKQVFGRISTAEKRDKDKLEVERFIDDMEVLFAIEDLKKKDVSFKNDDTKDK